MTVENDQKAGSSIETSSIAPWLQQIVRMIAVASFGTRVETVGLQQPDLQQALSQTAILAVARHDSHFNTPVVQTALGQYLKRMVTVAKETYFTKNSPQLALRLFNHRWYLLGETLQSQKTLAETVRQSKITQENNLFLMYPQGTRDNPDTQPFNRGISFIARQADVPIVPILLSHSHETIMPKGTSVWSGLKTGLRRVWQGQSTIETVSLGVPVDPVQIKEQHPHVKTGRQLDDAIMDALAAHFIQMFCQLGQAVPPFVQSKSR